MIATEQEEEMSKALLSLLKQFPRGNKELEKVPVKEDLK